MIKVLYKLLHKNEYIKSKPTLRRSILTKMRDGMKPPEMI